MVIVVGLGNPGRRYAGTRHNIGFVVADAVAERLTGGQREPLETGALLTGQLKGHDVALVWPATFMNRSGEAVQEVLERFGAAPEDLLVTSDDVYLPLGTLRLRLAGADGGHNGLASVLAAAGHSRVPRLRVGVGHGETRDDLVEYVLAEFEGDEKPRAAAVVRAAADCVEMYVDAGPAAAMNAFNGRETEGEGR